VAQITSEGSGKLINPVVVASRLNLGFTYHSLHILVSIGAQTYLRLIVILHPTILDSPYNE